MPMILRSSPPSPFGRKVKIAASVLGLMEQITVEIADPNDAEDSLREQNPLGKIPVLLTDDGQTLYDSRVIVEYLDMLAGGGRILPTEQKERVSALHLQALADGMMDSGILQVYERRMRPEEKWYQPWLDYQAGKIARALEHLETHPPVLHKTPTVGEIATACALGYLDLRFDGTWRANHPTLVEWLKAFADTIPAFEATKPAA